jgi:hypothetical protein
MQSEGMTAAREVSPLTVLVQGVLEWTFPPDTFAPLFSRYAGGQYDRHLTLACIFWLLVSVVTGGRRSVFAAFQADQATDRPTIPTSHQALYAKLGRTCPELGPALLRHSADRLLPLLHHADPRHLWNGYEVRVWDGTDLDGSEHRLLVLRRTQSAGLPGRLIVEYDLASGLCSDAVASEDAYACEMKLVLPLVGKARRRRVYVADRNFCCWDILSGLHQRKARFVIREHQKLRIREEGEERYVGRAPTGEVYQQGVRVEDRHTGESLALRRVILRLDEPTVDGDTEIRLLTDLPRKIKAAAVAELYRRRWRLEGHFDFVKNQLKGEVESLGRPRAALLMMCLAMVAANALAVVRGALKQSHGIEPEGLSGYYLADELAGNYRAVQVLLKSQARAALAALAVAAFWDWCLEIAAEARPRAFEKHPRGPKRPQPRRASGKGKPHYSTFRLLNEAQE